MLSIPHTAKLALDSGTQHLGVYGRMTSRMGATVKLVWLWVLL